MRLFVALLPPPAILDELELAVTRHREAWPHLKWVRRDLWHVTLAFLGEVPEDVMPELTRRLERAARRHQDLELSLSSAGAFPQKGTRARVLWTGLHGDRPALAALAASVQAAARRSGIADVDEKFHPHLTLARCRVPEDVRPLLEGLSPYAGNPWTAAAIHLMRSHLGRQVRYESIASWPLRPPKA